MTQPPVIDPEAPLLFVVNAASGVEGAQARREVIESTMRAAGRPCELLFADGAEVTEVACRAAAQARSRRSAVVAVGGDGTINAVAQAAHAEGCAMGVLPQGTFNYFARTNGIPAEPAAAIEALLRATPRPVQVGVVNGKVFLVNASLGLYPALLEDRESHKARFGRHRWVALLSALTTLARTHRQLRLRIEQGGQVRDVRTPTLFVGNNRLQLEQVGVRPEGGLAEGEVAAVMLRPIGTLAMLWLAARGALGSLGEADDVESFAFRRMVVKPSLRYGRARIKIAVDGEVLWMRMPLEFRVADQPLFLLAPAAARVADDADEEAAR